ncbi:DUF285 domain-containing protein (plasmid) [Bombilactobacillus folatiphilus]|uniref:DUF285 domain-containing protein n=1 Tax=Bombilactobacillus folatiphilus TaxID=2923362 RepID=A0ABY4P6P2_9LACO|nr:BspA family leucine-rich repeat surface protein [Bombilactobacillus folatiphilus]UQS81438.1 DUF285 domain-containing protein [Bombilactobacillus folatiphilus]UQS82829.1 DUF285 domain-containing protein [Bombilactobacillus folatiphilus]UQS82949.1 DUF285 domain-containing protein [Bombilactobacillus folatiphilus]
MFKKVVKVVLLLIFVGSVFLFKRFILSQAANVQPTVMINTKNKDVVNFLQKLQQLSENTIQDQEATDQPDQHQLISTKVSADIPATGVSGTDGTCAWTLDAAGNLTINSGTLNQSNDRGIGWDSDHSGFYAYRTNIKQIDFAGPVTAPVNSQYLFQEMSNLVSFTNLSNFITNQTVDTSYMFYDCRGLIKLDVSNFDTSNVTNMSGMFSSCNNVTHLDVSNFDTSNVTNMSGMFSSCNNVTHLDVSGFDTSKVTNMSNMFSNCRNTDLDVSNFDTSNVTSMSGMFSSCNNVTHLDVSGFDTSNVTSMSGMFSSCNNVTHLDVSNFDTSNVTNMSGMFSSCNNVTHLDVSGFDTSKVTNMSNMFDGCRNTDLDVNGFDTSNVTNMSGMFSSCNNVTHLDVSGFDTSKVTNMSYMFSICSHLTSLDLSNFDTSKVTNMSYMFQDCSKLPKLDVGNFDTGKVNYMSGMFSMCYGLTKLDLNNFDTSKVTNMSSMFTACSGLTKLDLSNFDTSKVTNMSDMFDSCTRLTKLDLNNFDTSKVTNMSDMFDFCPSLWGIQFGSQFIIPSNVSPSLAMPTIGNTFIDNDKTYLVTAAAWQDVGNGSDHKPTGPVYDNNQSLVSSLSSPHAPFTYVWQNELQDVKPTLSNVSVTDASTNQTGTTTSALTYCYDSAVAELPSLTVRLGITDTDSTKFDVYYGIDPVTAITDAKDIVNNANFHKLPASDLNPGSYSITDQTDLCQVAQPKSGGHRLVFYAVTKDAQGEAVSPGKISQPMTITTKENLYARLHYKNSNGVVIKSAQPVIFGTAGDVIKTDGSDDLIPPFISHRNTRYQLSTANSFPKIDATTSAGISKNNPKDLDVLYDVEGAVTVNAPSLDFGKGVPLVKKQYHLQKDSAEKLIVTDTTGAPCWQLSLAITPFSSDKQNQSIDGIMNYQPVGLIGASPILISQFNETDANNVQTGSECITNISNGWWQDSQQTSGPMLDISNQSAEIIPGNYQATATWSVVDSLN